MPNLPKQAPELAAVTIKRTGPKNPQDARIHHSNCCIRWLYNIPQGTCMLALPGALILMMGVIVLPWTTVEEGWSEGTQQAGILFVAFGGVLTLGGLIYGCYYYNKHAPSTPSKKTVSPHPHMQHVELVGVYKIRQDGMSVPKDTFDNAMLTSISTIS